MTRLNLLLMFMSVLMLSCEDIGTNVDWSEWDLVNYQNASFSVPPHTTWRSFDGGLLAGEGGVDVEGDDFVFWLYYGRTAQELYSTYRVNFSTEIPTILNGQAAILAAFTHDPTMNDGPQRGISVFISDVGNGGNQLLLLVLHNDPSKDYIANLTARSVRIR